MSEELKGLTESGMERRTLLKGAAWSAPVLAASMSAPLAAATDDPGEPDCPDCLRPGVGLFELAGLAASSRATLLFAAPVVLDATGCGSLIGNIFDFKPAFTYIVTKATLEMSDGATYDSGIGLAPGAGVLGAVGAMAAAFQFSNVRVDSNDRRTGPPRNRPASLTVQIDSTYKWGLGAEKLCSHTLVYDLSSAINVSGLLLGGGVITYTGTTSSL